MSEPFIPTTRKALLAISMIALSSYSIADPTPAKDLLNNETINTLNGVLGRGKVLKTGELKEVCFSGDLVVHDINGIKQRPIRKLGYTLLEKAPEELFKASVGELLGADESQEEIKQFLEFIHPTPTSLTFLASAEYNSSWIKLEVNSSSPKINEVGEQALSQSNDEFVNHCGDNLINYAKLGGRFYFAVRLDFPNQKMATHAEANSPGNYSFVDSDILKGWIDQQATELSPNINITTSVLQRGGDKELLSEVENLLKESKDCLVKGSNTNKCHALINTAEEYVKAGALDTFQMKPIITEIDSDHYYRFPVNIKIGGNLPEYDLYTARSKLATSWKKQFEYKTALSALLYQNIDEIVNEHWESYFQDYDDALGNVNHNINMLNEAISICKAAQEACYASSTNTIANLIPVSLPLKPASVYPGTVYIGDPHPMELSCQAPAGSVITGFGAKVRNDNVEGIKIAYRALNADNTLGKSHYKQCGSGVELFAEVPDGNVLTGLGVGAHRDNLTSIKLYQSRWNSESRILNYSGEAPFGRIYHSEKTIVPHNLQTPNYFVQSSRAAISYIGLKVTNDNISGLRLGYNWME
ncbi:hypothetical protein HCH_01133 [Hahella chejuensis KCTC 2396]|uniref:Jacalin-type lectin domain-containing protein n=1 Tax=Hahella chejuensis (strain KCTC 2396) TaxID=349521 RepID=Q2SMW3_HAHCH|nr:hypothetical protein [Hahella chejuensis]ABC28011.1 hypothetical protein HCH_01133 [Hahella chejuensis KCTC 2396]